MMRDEEVGGYWIGGFGDDKLIIFMKKLEDDNNYFNNNHSPQTRLIVSTAHYGDKKSSPEGFDH